MAAPATSAVEPLWLRNARDLVGLREIVGSRHEPKVLEFFKESGHPEVHDDETAWCAAFANAMLRRAGFAGTGALNARSFLTWGTKLDAPKPGCIVVYKRGNSDWQGHVNFFTRKVGHTIYGVGGNQSNAVNETTMNEADVLGYRWPLIVTAPALKPKAPVKEAVKTAAKVVIGGGAVLGGKQAVEAGWGLQEWLLLVIGLAMIGAAGYAAWRWWSARKAEPVPVVEDEEAHGAEAVAAIAEDTVAGIPTTEIDPLEPLPPAEPEKALEVPAATDGSSSTVTVQMRSSPAAAPKKRKPAKKAKPAPKKRKATRKKKAA